MEIKYFVRTTGERKFNYDLEYETITDAINKPVKAFIEALYKISSSNAVLLEDDLILCNNFKEEIEKVIETYPNDIINFFTKPDLYFTTHYTDRFDYNQCTYYPKGISKLLAEKIITFKNWDKIGYDLLMNKALVNLNISHVQYRPCLVQHIDIKSLLPFHHFKPRRCVYFIDYLEELNISYEDAWTKENKQKLIALMESKFSRL